MVLTQCMNKTGDKASERHTRNILTSYDHFFSKQTQFVVILLHFD